MTMRASNVLAALLLTPALAQTSTEQPATGSPGASGNPAEPPRCALVERAVLDMEMDQTGRIWVPVSINGMVEPMMVDTGAARTMVSYQTVATLKLPIGVAKGGSLKAFGGAIASVDAHIDELRFGNVRAQNFNLFIVPFRFNGGGLLGGDFLRRYDIDFDFAAGKLSFLTPQNCTAGAGAYWTTKQFGAIPFIVDDDNHIVVKVILDGKPITAAIDTGAADTIMSLEKASAAFKLDEGKLHKSHHYPFQSLSIGDVAVANPAVLLVGDEETVVMGQGTDDTHMIIGMGVLRRLHLYISYREKMLYVTPATQY
jgi:predicted aspartyl protease